MFFSVQKAREATAECDGCPLADACVNQALDEVYLDVTGEPIAWVVRGGMTPIEQVRLWRAVQAGRPRPETMAEAKSILRSL